MKTALLLCTALLTMPVMAEGEELFKDNCLRGCHVTDMDPYFSRDDKKATNYAGLAGFVSNCISMTGAELFPDDEQAIVDYLNNTYYNYPEN
jgi:hypothetical protein